MLNFIATSGGSQSMTHLPTRQVSLPRCHQTCVHPLEALVHTGLAYAPGKARDGVADGRPVYGQVGRSSLTICNATGCHRRLTLSNTSTPAGHSSGTITGRQLPRSVCSFVISSHRTTP